MEQWISIGLSPEMASRSLRMTLSEETTPEEIDQTADQLGEIVQRLRA